MNFVTGVIGGEPVLLVGLALDATWARAPRRARVQLAPTRVATLTVQQWVAECNSALKDLEVQFDDRIALAASTFHDVTTAVSALLRAVEKWMERHPGSNYEDRFEQLPEDEKRIVKTVELVQARLLLLPLLVNPKAATYGQRRPMPVYKVVHKIVRVLRPSAELKRVSIRLNGSSFRSVSAYESFETLPLTLIDNAVKYSLNDQQVDVEVTERLACVRVSVSSLSPFVPPADRLRIFERGFRSAVSEKVAGGSGVGLYLAELVATAHDTKVIHECDAKTATAQVNGVDYVRNIFSVDVPY